MRRLMLDALVLVVALVVGFAVVTKTPLGSLIPTSSPSQTTVVAAQANSAATPTAPQPTATAAPSQTDPTAAIKAVVEKANQEQQDAFAQNNPSLMKDTATADYYSQVAQINQQMASGGVASIKLVKLDWGTVTPSATTATATTTETWQTTYTDGTTDQRSDQNVYTLVLQNGTWLIQSDDQPTSGQSGTTTPNGAATSSSSGSSTGASVSVIPVSQTSQSNNWSGYSATGGTFTSVTGTWVVPQSDGTANAGATATWVGIGGVKSRDLIQAGTQETSDGSGTVRYSAWVETLPQASENVPLTVSPGDSVTVTISEQSTDNWLISLKNSTTGKTYETTVQYASSKSSAEWIHEAPSAGRRLVPVDSFGLVQFTNATATEDGKSVTIAQAGGTPITMVDATSSAVASPTALTSDGKGFSVAQVGSSTDVSTVTSGRAGRGFSTIGGRQ